MSDDFRRRLQTPTFSVLTPEGDFFSQPLSSRHAPHSTLRDLAITTLFVVPAIAIGIYGPYQRFVERAPCTQSIPSQPSCQELRDMVASERTAEQDTYLAHHCN